MKNRTVRKNLPILCCLATSLCASQAFAAWTGDKLHRGYNQGYGDFPPMDIDRKLSGAGNDYKAPEPSKPVDNSASAPAPAPVANQTQNYSPQNYQQPAYSSQNRGNYYYPPTNQRYNRNTSFNGPWNNNSTGFSGPWNNRGSSFSGPWNNNRSGYGGGPWNNSGSNFSGPWDNNGSNFSMPWGGNRGNNSGFSPWGNGSGFSW